MRKKKTAEAIGVITDGLDKGMKATHGFLAEFKKFIARGNVFEMAVGVVVGTGFTKIVNSLVADVLTPVFSLVTNKVDLSALRVVLSPATETVAENAIRYGAFLQNVISFLLQAFSVFLLIKLINRFNAANLAAEEAKKKAEEEKKKAEEAAAAAKAEEPVLLLREIRDLLQEQKTETK